MAKTVEVFFSFQSPYSYLALDSIYELGEKFDIELMWQPFSAKASGHQPPTGSVLPDKFSYMLEDTKRFADDCDIPLVYPPEWPTEEFDPGKVTRGALVAADMEVQKEFIYKVFFKWWGLGEDPNDDKFIAELCEDIDIDLGEFLSKVSTSDMRERVKGVYKRGRKLSVYDTPTLVVDGERYVGLDKIPYLAKRLEKML